MLSSDRAFRTYEVLTYREFPLSYVLENLHNNLTQRSLDSWLYRWTFLYYDMYGLCVNALTLSSTMCCLGRSFHTWYTATSSVGNYWLCKSQMTVEVKPKEKKKNMIIETTNLIIYELLISRIFFKFSLI